MCNPFVNKFSADFTASETSDPVATMIASGLESLSFTIYAPFKVPSIVDPGS